MKQKQILAVMALLTLGGCVTSGYPLIKKEESVPLVSSGRYCFTKPHVTIMQASQCGWISISENNTKGYTFNITYDNHETITGGGSKLRKNKPYYARILNEPLKQGPLKGWHILQVCESEKSCDYFPLRKAEGGFQASVTPEQDHIQTRQELLNHFTSQKKRPERIVVFYTMEYLDAMHNAMNERKKAIKAQNEGDL